MQELWQPISLSLSLSSPPPPPLSLSLCLSLSLSLFPSVSSSFSLLSAVFLLCVVFLETGCRTQCHRPFLLDALYTLKVCPLSLVAPLLGRCPSCLHFVVTHLAVSPCRGLAGCRGDKRREMTSLQSARARAHTQTHIHVWRVEDPYTFEPGYKEHAGSNFFSPYNRGML